MDLNLRNKTVLITGGSKGIGLACAKEFAAEGCNLHLVSRTSEDLETAKKEIEAENNIQVTIHSLDLSNSANVDQLAKDCSKIDILVNNAGIVIRGTAEDTPISDWRKTQEVNLDAVFMGTRAAIGAMKPSGGSIVNISSIEGMVGEATTAAYNASKGGVRIFTKSAALHCASQNYRIRVNSIHPGFIRTPMIDNALAKMPSDEVEALLLRMENEIPLGSMGHPEDIANGCLYLASDESKYVTGAELVIDGGYTCR